MWKKKWYPAKRPANYKPDFKQYEFEKAVWAQNHRRASAEEYREAMRELAHRCRI